MIRMGEKIRCDAFYALFNCFVNGHTQISLRAFLGL
jgi:hypothetical protein